MVQVQHRPRFLKLGYTPQTRNCPQTHKNYDGKGPRKTPNTRLHAAHTDVSRMRPSAYGRALVRGPPVLNLRPHQTPSYRDTANLVFVHPPRASTHRNFDRNSLTFKRPPDLYPRTPSSSNCDTAAAAAAAPGSNALATRTVEGITPDAPPPPAAHTTT